MVAAPVAELQLVGFGTVGQGQNLVPQANPENGHLAPQLPHGFGHLRHVLRVTGAIGQEYTIRFHKQDFLCCGVVGNNGHVAAPVVEAADDVQLDAAIHGYHMELGIGGAGIPALFAADPADCIPGHRGGGNDGQRRFGGGIRGSNQRPAAAQVTDASRQLPGVHPGNGGDVVLLQQLRQGFDAPEIGWEVVVVIHHHAADAGELALKVLLGNAVVANQGIGHHHHLVGVTQVGYNFLITGHGGVEHDFANPVCGAAEAVAIVLAPVLQDELAVNCFHGLSSFGIAFPRICLFPCGWEFPWDSLR